MAEYNPSKIIKDGNTYNFRDTTKIPLAGSNAISGDLIPSTDGTVDLGGSSYQWNNAYIKSLTINGTAAGDILTHNVSEFVNVTGAQTIGGVKTFSDGIKNKNAQQFIFNKEYSDATDNWLGIHNYLDKNSTRIGFYAIGDFNGNRGYRWFVRGQSTNSVEVDIFGFGRKRNETSYMYIDATLETDLIPTNNNSKSLGSSTNKWKSLNGINPGALSLPSTYVNVDTTNWVLDGSNVNIFTPASDGWFGIQAIDTVYDQTHYVFVGRNDSVSNLAQNILSPINGLWIGSYHGCVFIPVIKNVRYDIRCICSSIIATFYPCQGNV